DGEVLALFVVPEGFFDHVGGLPEDVVVGDGAVVGDGVLEELGLDPAGRDGHDADAARFQLDVQRPGEAQDEGLGRAVDALVRHGLEGRERVEVYDAAAALHIGQAELRHGDEGLVVYVYHGEVHVQRRLGEEGEAPEARDVAERGYEGLFLFQQLFVLLKAGRVAEVHGQDARGRAQLFCQLLQPLAAAGDEPDLVERLLRVYGLGELQAHARGSACYDCYFHADDLRFLYYAPKEAMSASAHFMPSTAALVMPPAQP